MDLVKFSDFRKLANSRPRISITLSIDAISLPIDPKVYITSLRASSSRVSLSSNIEAGLGAGTRDLGVPCLAPATCEVSLAITFTEKIERSTVDLCHAFTSFTDYNSRSHEFEDLP